MGDATVLKAEDVTGKALEAFWAVVAASYPGIKTGDFPPEADLALTEAAGSAVETWLFYNTPVKETDWLVEEKNTFEVTSRGGEVTTWPAGTDCLSHACYLVDWESFVAVSIVIDGCEWSWRAN